MTGGLPLRRRDALAGMAGTLILAGCAAGLPKVQARFARNSLALTTGDGRQLDVSVWEPAGPVSGQIAFSHGWGGSPDGCLRLIEPLAQAGWRVLAPLHTDSERHPARPTLGLDTSWAHRMHDMRALSPHLGEGTYVAAGHSYGALTALVLGGVETKVPEGMDGPLRDPRVVAAIAFSPPLSLENFVNREGFAKLAVPALIQTGTRDNPSFEGVGSQTWEDRLIVYEAPAPGNDRFALVLEGVDHNFGGGIGSRLATPEPLQDRQLDVAAEIAVLFAEGFGRNDRRAQAALEHRLSDGYPVRLTRR